MKSRSTPEVRGLQRFCVRLLIYSITRFWYHRALACSGRAVLASERPNGPPSALNCIPRDKLPGRAHYFMGSTSLASMSTAIERMIKSTDTTTRSCPFLRTKIPFRPSNGPLLMRTREPTVK